MQRAREALISILASRGYLHQPSLQVLDLFCGVGSVYFEFVSGGATQITGVDKNRKHISFIRDTLKRFGYEYPTPSRPKLTLICADVFRWLDAHISSPISPYDIVFLDPPYQLAGSKVLELIEKIFDRHLVDQEGLVVLEHGRQLDGETEKWSFFSTKKKYGGTFFSFFEFDQKKQD